MPAKRPERGVRISHFYAQLGPVGSIAHRIADTPEEAQRVRADWAAWDLEHGDAYRAGDEVPPPPHAERFDHWPKSG